MAAPDKLTIDTPEQIPLEFTLATLGSRFLALVIDTLLQLGTLLAVVALLAILRLLIGPFNGALGTPGDPLSTWLQAFFVLTWFAIYYLYFVFFEVRWGGQTPGKRVVGLRTIHASGRPATAYETILRNLIRVIDQLPVIYAVGMVSVFLTERSQRLGDLAAGTVVVHERPAEAFPQFEPTPAAVPRFNAARLTAAEIALVETFLRRREELVGVRQLRAGQIADRIRARLDLPPGPDDEALLEQVVAEYRATGRYR